MTRPIFTSLTERTRISPELHTTPSATSNWSNLDSHVTFWLGSWCVLLPNLVWLIHCPFHQNHSNRYIVLCLSVWNCLTQTSCCLTTWQLRRLHNVFCIKEYQNFLTWESVHLINPSTPPHLPVQCMPTQINELAITYLPERIGIYLSYHIGVRLGSTERFGMATLWLFSGRSRLYIVAYLCDRK